MHVSWNSLNRILAHYPVGVEKKPEGRILLTWRQRDETCDARVNDQSHVARSKNVGKLVAMIIPVDT